MADNGCYDCKERHLGCHSNCEKYLKWKKEYQTRMKQVKSGDRKHGDYFYHK